MQSLFKWVIFYSLYLFLNMQKGKLGTAIQATLYFSTGYKHKIYKKWRHILPYMSKS